jgi:hypothetical protein
MISCIYALSILCRFIKRFTEYAINTDDVVFDGLKKETDKLSSERPIRLSIKQGEYIDAYTQLLVRKAEAGTYEGLLDIYRTMTTYIETIVSEYINENEAYSDHRDSDSESEERIKQLMNKQYLTFYRLWNLLYEDASNILIEISFEYEKTLKFFISKIEDRRKYEPLFFAYQRIAAITSVKMAREIPYGREFPWMWYFDLLSDSEIGLERQKKLDLYLLSAMQNIVNNDNEPVFNAFIGYAVDGIWNRIGDIYFDDAKQSDYYHKVKALIPYTEDWEQIEQAIGKEENEEYKAALRGFAEREQMFYNVQYLVAQIGAYCLFKERPKMINTILFYNQPKESYVKQLNRDINPADLNIVLKWYKDSVLTQFSYFNLWDGHSDSRYWFERYLGLLLFKIDSDHMEYRPLFNKDYTKQDYEYDELCLKKIKSVVDNISPKTLKRIGLLSDRDSVLRMISEAISNVRDIIDKVDIDSPLDEGKVQKFKSDVQTDIKSRSLWLNLLTMSSEDIRNPTPLSFDLGRKEIIDKSFLSQNDRGLYIGFAHSFAEIIINQIDYLIERALRSESRRHTDDIGISKDNYLNRIFDLDSEYMVVFISVH